MTNNIIKDGTKQLVIENIIKFREANGLTQKQVSDALNMNDATYRNWENGRGGPNYEQLVKITKLYNITPDILFGVNGSKTGQSTWNVASDNQYNKDIYVNKYLSELEISERAFIMRFRLLNPKDKERVFDFIDKIFPK